MKTKIAMLVCVVAVGLVAGVTAVSMKKGDAQVAELHQVSADRQATDPATIDTKGRERQGGLKNFPTN